MRAISIAAGVLIVALVSWAVAGAPGGPRVRLHEVAAGLARPVHVTHAGDGSGRLFIVEQGGLIKIMRGGRLLPAPFLDIRDRVVAGGDVGFFSVAFHPRYAQNGRFFVNHAAGVTPLRAIIAEYRAGRHPDTADPAGRVILEIPHRAPYHMGGLNLFGPDGKLYIGVGDGGRENDPFENGQRLDTLFGKLLRIDVDSGAPYRIPSDNPFAGRKGVSPEIWAYGLRNPWRYSFDRLTGRLFLADVGQDAREEINVIERGGNYGWKVMEGAYCRDRFTGCDTTGLEWPIIDYGRALGCAVTGGVIYRGAAIPILNGRYVFGDFCSGRIWSLDNGPRGWAMTELWDTPLHITSFGEDEDGAVYVLDYGGAMFRIDPY
jgi:glucose/arabinose dehydrogenase